MEASHWTVKLREYRGKLKGVEDSLAIKPHDHTLIKLREDLIQLIDSTQALIRVKADKAKPAASSDAPVAESWPQGEPQVGDTCMAKWSDDAKFYFARITSADLTAKQFQVRYLEYGSTATLPLTELRPATPVRGVQIGSQVKAVFPGDGLLYEATVKALPSPESEDKYRVEFVGYVGDVESLDSRDIVAVVTATTGKRPRATEGADGGVPEHLMPHPGDSAEERATKKRKLKALRYQEHVHKQEEERSVKQTEWLSFKNGAGSKRRTGFLSSTRKESIFRTPTDFAARVGVTGSGRPMTEYRTVGKLVVKEASS